MKNRKNNIFIWKEQYIEWLGLERASGFEIENELYIGEC